MRRLRWQILIVLLALVAIAALLFSQQQPSIPGEKPVDQPVAGGIYSEALIGTLNRLNPVLDFNNSVDKDINRLIYSSLVRFDHRGLPFGDLAESWGISQDGRVYNFSLRPESKWHDGEPVTSDDIIFTVDLLRNDALPIPEDLRSFWKQVELKALDEHTLQFRLPEPFSPFMDYLSFGILPRHLLEGLSAQQLIDSPFNLNPVGSGPFRLKGINTENDKVTGVVLEDFADYYGNKPFLEDLIFHFFPDEDTALEAYRQGQVMGISQISRENLQQSLTEPNLQLFTGRLPRLSLVYLNLDDPKSPFFKELEIRKALLMAINRRRIIDRLLNGQAIEAYGPIFPESWAFFGGVEHIPYDPEMAIELLRKSGYTFPAEGGQVRSKDGVLLSFDLVYPDIEMYASVAEQIRKDWERIGVEAKLLPVSYEELLTDYLEPRTYQAVLADLDFTHSPDPDPYPFWHQAQTANGQNYSQWDDRQVSEYLEQARVEVDLNERIKRYKNFQVRFASELPALPLFYPVYSYAVSDKIHGVSIGPINDPSDRFNNISSWYLLTGTTAQNESTQPPE